MEYFLCAQIASLLERKNSFFHSHRVMQWDKSNSNPIKNLRESFQIWTMSWSNKVQHEAQTTIVPLLSIYTNIAMHPPISNMPIACKLVLPKFWTFGTHQFYILPTHSKRAMETHSWPVQVPSLTESVHFFSYESCKCVKFFCWWRLYLFVMHQMVLLNAVPNWCTLARNVHNRFFFVLLQGGCCGA